MIPAPADNLSDPAEKAEPVTATTAARESRKALLKAAVLAAILLAALLVVYFSPLKTYLPQQAGAFKSWLRQCGIWAPLVFTAAVAVLVSIGVPRLALCVVGGGAFGLLWGVIWSCLGTLIGYYGLFLFIRWGGKDLMLRHHPLPRRLTGLLRQQGIPAVILIRQMPIHGMIANLVLGLSHVRHRDFLIGTALGLIPEAVPLTFFGAGAMKGEFTITSLYFILGAVILAVVWILLAKYGRPPAPAADNSKPTPNGGLN